MKGIVAEPQGEYTPTNFLNQWVEVLVDHPLSDPSASGLESLFVYRIPSEITVQPGDILSVPFGQQVLGAIAIRLLSRPPAEIPVDKIREIEEVVTQTFFPPHYWQLLDRVAQYYHTPLIQVLRVALPPGLLQKSQRRVRLLPLPENAETYLTPIARQVVKLLQSQPQGDYSVQYLQRQIKGASRGLKELLRRGWVEKYLETPRSQRPKLQQAVTLVQDQQTESEDLTPRQREVLEVLRREGGDLWLQALLQRSQTSSNTLKTLEKKGYIVIQEREILRSSQEPTLAPDQAKTLTSAQANALKAIGQITGHGQLLLHGVTGSGKTEVYLQAIAPILNQGQSALVLVPEIGLTPQLTDRFRARFGEKVCVYHSALSDGERYDTWRQMLMGEPQVVIGTRSAVFSPLPQLGLIILDEEHDSSFKQDQPSPTYHARQVAQWRAELADCPLILGSATPSLETWIQFQQSNPETQHFYLSLPERIQARPLPPVEVVDMRMELQGGNRSIFSRPLQEALEQLRDQGKQGILFIHRRGHSSFVSCRSCGYVMDCPHCDVSLSYHHAAADATELLRCHYCNYGQLHPRTCPECGSPYFKFFGSGTQKVAQELTRQFPHLRYIRFDSDTTRYKGAHRELLTQFAQGEADLLIGTQMLTKGLDLPQVTLVGVIAADGLLHLSDFRASERAFQTLTQVAGRSGRGDEPGRVIIQTYTPSHPVIQAVQEQDYPAFMGQELKQRQDLNYPPQGRLLLFRFTGEEETAVVQGAERLAALLSELIVPGAERLGPSPANIPRVANRYRWQVLLKWPLDQPLALPSWEVLRSLRPQGVTLSWDIDPLNFS